MMDVWIAFVLASTIILVIPGPTIILVISQSVAHGYKSVIPLVLGVLLGDFVAMTCSLLGLGALMTASAALFNIFKCVGAVYLVYLGIKMWVQQPVDMVVESRGVTRPSRSLFRRSFLVTALNPKSIAFFVAFFPQFVNHQKPVFSQLVILGITFLVLAGLNAALYAFFGGHLRDFIRKKRVRKWINRTGGGALIGAGIITAGMKRSA